MRNSGASNGTSPKQCELMMEKKVAEFPPKIAPKEATHFLHNSDIITISPKSHQNIWATFVSQFVAKNF